MDFLDRFSKKKYSNTKFDGKPSSGSRVVPCGQTDGHDEANSRFSQNLSKRPNTVNIPQPTAVPTLRRQVSQTHDLNTTSVHLPRHTGFKSFYRGADKSLARPGRKQAQKHVRDARDFNKRETPAVIKFLFLQGKAPQEIHAFLTETLACFIPGRAKDLSAPLYYALSSSSCRHWVIILVILHGVRCK